MGYKFYSPVAMKYQLTKVIYQLDDVNRYRISGSTRFAHTMKPLRIPPLIIDIVQSGLLACEGIVFETRNSCPVCGGKLSGYDTKKKQFAVLLEGNTRASGSCIGQTVFMP